MSTTPHTTNTPETAIKTALSTPRMVSVVTLSTPRMVSVVISEIILYFTAYDLLCNNK